VIFLDITHIYENKFFPFADKANTIKLRQPIFAESKLSFYKQVVSAFSVNQLFADVSSTIITPPYP